MGPGTKQDILTDEFENDEEYINLLVDTMIIENQLDEDEKSEEDKILESFGY